MDHETESESYQLEQGKEPGTATPRGMADAAPLAPEDPTLAGANADPVPDSADADRVAAEVRSRERGRGK